MTVMPETQKSQGYTQLYVLTTAASLSGITVAELTAGEAIQCYLYGDFNAGATENIGEGPRKMCARQVPQQFGNVTYTIDELMYSYLPQELDAAAGNEAKSALTPGTTKILVEFPGLDGTGTAPVATDKYIAHKVELGIQRRGRTGDGEFDEFAIRQSLIYADGGEPIEGTVAA